MKTQQKIEALTETIADLTEGIADLEACGLQFQANEMKDALAQAKAQKARASKRARREAKLLKVWSATATETLVALEEIGRTSSRSMDRFDAWTLGLLQDFIAARA